MVEIKNHADEIVRRTGLSIEKLGKVLTFLEKGETEALKVLER
jgi:hypothetical protein